MDHDISIKTQAAEKYLLGELQPEEREAFEQHFFECPECAEEVRLGFQFGDNAKAVFRQGPRRIDEPERPLKPRNWLARMWTDMRPVMWVPVAAGLTIVAFSGYQNAVEIPALRARVDQLETPQLVASTVLTPSARSAAPMIVVSPGAQFFQLSLAPGAVTAAGQFRCELRAESGKALASVVVPKLDADSNVTILVPAAGFTNGYYEAVLLGITGGNATELEHYRFGIRRE